MRAFLVLTTIALTLATGTSRAECQPLRFGYVDQHRPPYYLGDGAHQATPPGASVELVREMSNATGCGVQVTRLPVPRLRRALSDGVLDAVPLDANSDGAFDAYAFPLDKQGNADRERAMQQLTVMFVRASDKLPDDTKPAEYFRGRRVGVNHGASYAEALRKLHIAVDDGGLNTERNMEKLLRGRIDGFAIPIVHAADMDNFVQRRFGAAIVRLPTPVRVTAVWLAFNKAYVAHNRQQVEAMWNWLGAHGNERFADLLRQYEKQP